MTKTDEKEFKRHFDADFFERNKEELKKIVDVINKFDGQVDFQIRSNNAFTVYHLGQGVGRVEYKKDGIFNIAVSKSFKPVFPKNLVKHAEIVEEKSNNTYRVNMKNPSGYFTKGYIEEICMAIKNYAHQEERQIQQKILADNIYNPDFFIIDSEISVPGRRDRLDLLGLRKTKQGSYRLVLLELKLINNKEAEDGKVIEQLNGYENVFKENIEALSKSYEINYGQKRELGLYNDDFPVTIKIEKEIEKAIIIAGGYTKSKILAQNLKDDNSYDGKIIIMHLDLAKEFAEKI